MARPPPKSVVQTGYGGTEVFEVQHRDRSPPGPREVCVRHTAIGVNFHDLYVRAGLYKTLAVPGVPGIEAVGEVTAIGREVTAWRVGQRVGYITRGYGAYCEERTINESLLLEPPIGLPDDIAATSLLRGLTAAMLLEQVTRITRGDLVLIHAAAGSTGTLLVPWARRLGARVIATAGKRVPPDQTAALCEQIYSYLDADWDDRVRADHGASVSYICDSVGSPTLAGSMNVAAPCGHVALFGQSGGNVESIPIRALAVKSLTITRPNVFDYSANPERRAAMMKSFTTMISEGIIALPTPLRLRLDQAGKAHQLIEERSNSAPIALIP